MKTKEVLQKDLKVGDVVWDMDVSDDCYGLETKMRLDRIDTKGELFFTHLKGNECYSENEDGLLEFENKPNEPWWVEVEE